MDEINDCNDHNHERLSSDEYCSLNNKRCPEMCTNSTCKCSPLHFRSKNGRCLGYTELLSKNTGNETIHPKYQRHNGMLIHKRYVDDLVSACGESSEDEVLYKSLLKNSSCIECLHPWKLACKISHPKCFNISDICTYKLDTSGNLIPCRIGSHLENCEDFECNIHFKCPGRYCISWSYVCNGIWDCPFGYDEIKIHNCGLERRCKHMLRCKNSQACLHIKEVCNSENQCPLGDDELNCGLKEMICPVGCLCLNFGIMCSGSDNNSADLYNLPFVSYHLHHINKY